MKRKGRKPKTLDSSTNGVADRQDQNGDASERDEKDFDEQEDKRRKSGKRKSGSKKVENETEEDTQNEDFEEPEEKKRKSGKRKSASKKTDDEVEDEPQYEVEHVLDEKNINGVRHYLIRWKGYEPESDTWEPESTLNCSELIAEFKAKQKKKGKSKLSKKRASNTDVTWDENEDFEVERILDVYFKRNGQREFLVSWKGYPTSQNSWEPEENMDCKDLIKKFMSKVERAKESDLRELRIKRTHTDRLTLMSGGPQGRRLSKRNQGKQRVHYHEAE